jgi:hypothetical protein
LQKARNDARAVGDTLRAAGFGVTLALDPDADGLYDALARFASALRPGDEVVVYFAGHGVEVEGRNWLLPADMAPLRPGDEVKLRRAALATDDLLAEITARGPQVTLMILDACRDNPFPRQGTRFVGNTRGLARLEAPRGSYVIYSAGAGQTALDRLGAGDANPNSVFTRALLPRLAEPGLSIRDLAQQVRMEVDQTARSIGHDQFPAIYDQLAGEFSIVPTAASAPKLAVTAPAALVPQDPCDVLEARLAEVMTYSLDARIGAIKTLWALADEAQCTRVAKGLNALLAQIASEEYARANSQKPTMDTHAGRLGLTFASEGELKVVAVTPGSAAFEKAIQAGDVLKDAGQTAVATPAEFEKIAEQQIKAGRRSILLLIYREGEPRFVALPLK